MTDENSLRKAQGRRLAAARMAAGYDSARSAALDCGWPESTYRAHENGTRTIGQNDAARYIRAFQLRGAKGFSGVFVLYGTGEEPDESLDDLIKDSPAAVRQKAYEAVRKILGKS